MAEKHTFLDTIQKSEIQKLIKGVRGYANELTLEVERDHLIELLTMLVEKFQFTYLADITGIDNYSDDHRFEVSYNLVSLSNKQRLRVATTVSEEDAKLPTTTAIWKAADWFEREVFDMIGITFEGHPDLRRMYMPEDYEFFPLRKEFPLLGIPGSIPLPDKDPPKPYN